MPEAQRLYAVHWCVLNVSMRRRRVTDMVAIRQAHTRAAQLHCWSRDTGVASVPQASAKGKVPFSVHAGAKDTPTCLTATCTAQEAARTTQHACQVMPTTCTACRGAHPSRRGEPRTTLRCKLALYIKNMNSCTLPEQAYKLYIRIRRGVSYQGHVIPATEASRGQRGGTHHSSDRVDYLWLLSWPASPLAGTGVPTARLGLRHTAPMNKQSPDVHSTAGQDGPPPNSQVKCTTMDHVADVR